MKVCHTCRRSTNSTFSIGNENHVLCYKCAKKEVERITEDLNQQRKEISRRIKRVWHELRQNCFHESGYRKHEIKISGRNVVAYYCNDCSQHIDKHKIKEDLWGESQ